MTALKFRRTLLGVATIVAAVELVSRVSALEPGPPKEATNIERIKVAESSEELREAYRLYFKDKPYDDLKALESNDDPGIALAAVWERVRRALGATSPKDLKMGVAISADELAGFGKLIKDKLKCDVPHTWMRALEMSIIRDTQWVLQHPNGGYLYEGYRLSESRVHVLKDTIVEFTGDEVVLGIDERTCRLSKQLSKQLLKAPREALVAAICKDETWLVAAHSTTPPLIVDPIIHLGKDGKLLWQAEVWGGVPTGRSGNRWAHWMRIVVQDQNVYVFGITDIFLYIEGFSLRDGGVQFRFSTSY